MHGTTNIKFHVLLLLLLLLLITYINYRDLLALCYTLFNFTSKLCWGLHKQGLKICVHHCVSFCRPYVY